MIKRVLGVPGDTIAVTLKGVFRNGEQVSDPPPNCDATTRFLPIQYGTRIVGPNEFWMTTNLYLSLDSRVYGPVHRSQILSHAAPVLTTFDPKKHITSSPLSLLRTDCRTVVSSEKPLRDQVQLLTHTAASDSLQSSPFNQQFRAVTPFRPSLSFRHLFFPPDTPASSEEATSDVLQHPTSVSSSSKKN
jgi:Type IV secretory pathway, protease TraF